MQSMRLKFSNQLLIHLVNRLQSVVDSVDYSKVVVQDKFKYALLNADQEEREEIYRDLLLDCEAQLQPYFKTLKRLSSLAVLLNYENSKQWSINTAQVTNTLIANILHETNLRYTNLIKNESSVYLKGAINE